MIYEVEQKFRAADQAALAEALAGLGAEFGSAELQVDAYYAHPARDFRRTDEAFRLRSIGERNFATYKGPKIDAATKTRREIEVPLAAGPAEASRFGEMLEALGFRRAIVVRKSRRKGCLRRGRFDVEVALDQVEKLGDFIEFEIQAETESLDAARECLAELARTLNLVAAERRGYADLLESTVAGNA